MHRRGAITTSMCHAQAFVHSSAAEPIPDVQVSLTAFAFDINPRAFTPPPQVDSTVISLKPRAVPLAPANAATLERVTAAAFGQRRKMLRQSLKSLGGDPIALCEASGVDPTARAEALSVEQFCALARNVDSLS